jgi:ATP:ADP antiporter, AAA family
VSETSSDRRGPIDRLLALGADVRPGEGTGALLLASNVFLLLAFYYLLKTVREALILSEGGAEVKSYAAAGQGLLLLVFVPAYGAFASRVNRLKLINWVTLFFASHLVIFYLLGVAGMHIGVAFFLWIGVFSLVMPAQIWAYANDVYEAERGKRLFPIVGIGASLGAWTGAAFAGELFERVGSYPIMLIAAAGLPATLLLTQVIERRVRRGRTAAAATAEAPIGKAGGFQLILSQRYLLFIALFVLVTNIVNTLGEYILASLVTADVSARIASGAAPAGSEDMLIGAFYGRFFAWVNFLGFAFQLLLVSRLFKWLGVRGTLFVLPVIAAVTYGTAALMPVLGVITLVKMMENSTDYSINNTTRHALFLPTSREAKYKAKQAIDAFFWRAGDVLQAGVVFAGAELLAWTTRGFAAFNLAVVVVWIGIGIGIARQHRKITGEETLPANAAAEPA